MCDDLEIDPDALLCSEFVTDVTGVVLLDTVTPEFAEELVLPESLGLLVVLEV